MYQLNTYTQSYIVNNAQTLYSVKWNKQHLLTNIWWWKQKHTHMQGKQLNQRKSTKWTNDSDSVQMNDESNCYDIGELSIFFAVVRRWDGWLQYVSYQHQKVTKFDDKNLIFWYCITTGKIFFPKVQSCYKYSLFPFVEKESVIWKCKKIRGGSKRVFVFPSEKLINFASWVS